MNKEEFKKLKSTRLSQVQLRGSIDKPVLLVERRTENSISDYLVTSLVIKEVKNSKRSNNIEVIGLVEDAFKNITHYASLGTYINEDGFEKFYSSGHSVTSFFITKK